MNNTVFTHTNSSWFYLLNQDAATIDLVQSSISLIITFCIFFKVFDFASFKKSIREKRNKAKRDKEKAEFERIKLLIASLQNNEDVSSLKLTDDSDDESKVSKPMKIARKKTKSTPRPPVDAGSQV
jgi:high-affinity K+ transport system ATPase subunit B